MSVKAQLGGKDMFWIRWPKSAPVEGILQPVGGPWRSFFATQADLDAVVARTVDFLHAGKTAGEKTVERSKYISVVDESIVVDKRPG